jgi:hypothetical protein
MKQIKRFIGLSCAIALLSLAACGGDSTGAGAKAAQGAPGVLAA